ncbi:MAG: HAD family hydrolase [Dissulfurispiraceae bacterium]|jgi:5-amino-6-(5-phospho-D-ribitylamino)uracil phosphatase
MNKTAGRLYISDLDGTLLRNDAMLSGYTKQKLNELLSDGLHFTVASARNVHSVRSLLDGVNMTMPIIGSNGAYISEFETGSPLMINSIDNDVAKEIFSLIGSHGSVPFVTSHNGKEDCLYLDKIINDGMLWYLNERTSAGDKRLRMTNNVEEKLDERIICLNVINTKEHLEDLFTDIISRYTELVEVNYFENPYSPGWYWMTVYDRKATKEHAIKSLMEMLALQVSELTVFGDSRNDISMFKIASKAVAVANALDEVKSYASEIIGPNEEDGVVNYISSDLARNNG